MRHKVHVSVKPMSEDQEPVMQSRPELKYALETILDNADGYATDTIEFTISWTSKSLILEVVDDGVGFKQTVINRLGQPFNSTRKGQAGHRGLGLYLAMSLIENMGGQMSIQNNKGKGGHVVLQLPRTYI